MLQFNVVLILTGLAAVQTVMSLPQITAGNVVFYTDNLGNTISTGPIPVATTAVNEPSPLVGITVGGGGGEVIASTPAVATPVQGGNGLLGLPTPFTYTTLNAAGQPVTLVDTFTPSFAPTVSVVPTGTGTILDYSAWSSIYGTKQTGTSKSSASSLRKNGASSGVAFAAAAVTTISLMFGAIFATQ